MATKRDCQRMARAIIRACGFSSFDALHRVVITCGFLSAGLPRETFERAEHGFHAAQACLWAAEVAGETRGRWLESVRRNGRPFVQQAIASA